MTMTERQAFTWFLHDLNGNMIQVEEYVKDLPARGQMFRFRVGLRPDRDIKPGQCPNLSDDFYCSTLVLALVRPRTYPQHWLVLC